MMLLLAALSGVIFGLGLIAAGMTDPAKVKNFLDLFGAWDPSLAFVMGGAIAVGSVAFLVARRQGASWTGHAMDIPGNRTIDRRLVIGGLLFGAGWGVAGFCPGPAIVAASQGLPQAWLFLGAMLVGMTVHDKLAAR
jgi:uncharacterized membrane protein YedE/YeeE